MRIFYSSNINTSMYPQINKEQTPSAPPPYFESSMNQGQQPYANFNNQMLHPSAAYNDPNKTVIIQTSTSECLKLIHVTLFIT